jgi:hypothetical protein
MRTQTKILLSFIGLFIELTVLAQSTFNRMHPVNCQDQPATYRADGRFQAVFEIDKPGLSQDGYLTLGSGILKSPSQTDFPWKAFVSKMNLEGDLMWSSRFESDQDTIYQSFGTFSTGLDYIRNESGNISLVLADATFDEDHNFTKLRLLELNDYGVIIDTSDALTFESLILVKGMIQDMADSSFILYGLYQDSTITKPMGADGLLIKLSRSGDLVWVKRIPEVLQVTQIAKQLDSDVYILTTQPNTEGSLYCSGDITSYNLDVEFTLYDLNSGVLDRVRLGGSCYNSIGTVILSDSTAAIIGFLSSEVYDENCSVNAGRFFTQRVGWTGSEIEQENVDYFSYNCLKNTVTQVKLNRSNEPIIVGDCRTYNSPYSYGYVYKLTNDLDSAWFRMYTYYQSGINIEHRIYNLIETSDSSYVCVGSVRQAPNGSNPLLESPWIFKVDSYGCLEPGCQYVGVSEMVIGLQDAMRVYPNPVVDLLTVGFSLPAGFSLDEDTQLVLTDMQGRTLLSENIQQRGWENFRHIINVQDLAAGTYVLHWKSDTKWLDSATVVKN